MPEEIKNDVANVEGSDENQLIHGGKEMPAPLYSKVFQSIGVGVLILFASVVFWIFCKDSFGLGAFIAPALLGMLLIGKGIMILHKWRTGKIVENIYRCIACKRVIPFSVTSVTRMSERRYNTFYDIVCTEISDEEDPHLYEFRIGRDGGNVREGGAVILYVDEASPRTPVAWKVL